MLSDEEKDAIEILGEFKKNGFHLLNLKYESRVSTTKHIENSIETILNLIEKQSKEIEEAEQKERKAYIKGTNDADELCNKKWEDKIKAKIEELENEHTGCTHNVFSVLQSLLEKE